MRRWPGSPWPRPGSACPAPDITVASRTGDTPAEDRRNLARRPPDILITTPESLYLMLTSQAREVLRGVEHVIVDEVHAIAGSKRGAHLALSLERLDRLVAAREGSVPPQRIGLSATQRPLELIARFLGGVGPDRAVTVVDAGGRKALDLQVIVPIEDMTKPGELAAPRPAARRTGDRPRGPGQHLAGDPPADPRADPRAPQHDRLHEQPAPVGAARPAPERARRRGARPGPPRQRRPRAAGPDRGGPEGRPKPGDRRHELARARDRHGRGRSRHPGREPDVGRPRPPAGRPGRSPGRRAEQGRDLPEVPRRPARGGGRRPAGCTRARSRRPRSRATRSTSSPSRSSR